ncbi:uncharacterized protein LOC129617362 [Condylostylus longicornis]|uniref:uncharacterized protein LOC129617362 n=1 Tax=Condylostylus longicornis TaxID=2530218 RepID=UPI00244E0040|nr:uncharacterized protein LOC129617362 [Condylostylus longicornis]
MHRTASTTSTTGISGPSASSPSAQPLTHNIFSSSSTRGSRQSTHPNSSPTFSNTFPSSASQLRPSDPSSVPTATTQSITNAKPSQATNFPAVDSLNDLFHSDSFPPNTRNYRSALRRRSVTDATLGIGQSSSSGEPVNSPTTLDNNPQTNDTTAVNSALLPDSTTSYVAQPYSSYGAPYGSGYGYGGYSGFGFGGRSSYGYGGMWSTY